MSTRSSIAVEHKDGAVSAVYCHFDGYLDGVGAALVANHNSLTKAESLVALGDLRCVQLDGNVEAYKDREGEEWEHIKPREFATMAAYKNGADLGDNGYRYLFSGGQWLVWNEKRKPRPVSKPGRFD